MSQGDAGGGKTSRAATVEDLKRLAAALEAAGVDYVLIGGFALNALGYQRATTDIDLLIQPTAEQGRRTIQALLTLPDRVALQIDPRWFDEGETIRVADEFVVDLQFQACGHTLDSLREHVIEVDFEGVALRTLDLEGLLKTKQTSRAKDEVDRIVRARIAGVQTRARLSRTRRPRAGMGPGFSRSRDFGS
jgi:hypothetical protein